jgi:hypothetical protein
MHLVALGYPVQPSYAEKQAAKQFYESFTQLIPCPICRVHYTENLKEMPITPSLDTRKDLFRWTVDMHNKVNKQLGKPEYTEQQAITYYMRLGEMGRSPVWTPDDIQSKDFAVLAKVGGGALLLGGVAAVITYYYTQKA